MYSEKHMRKKLLIISSAAALTALAALYGVWLVSKLGSPWYGIAASLLSVLLFGMLTVFFLKGLFEQWFPEKKAEKDNIQPSLSRRERFSYKHPWLKIVGFMLLSRLGLILLGYLLNLLAEGGYSGGIIDTFRDIWQKWGTDAPSYYGIAENWYVTEGDARFHIVFFPFFPIMIRLFWYIFGNFFVSAMAVSTLSSIVSAVVLYELMLLDFDREASLRAVKYAFILPAAIFFHTPMTEALFLMLSLLCVYLIRRKRYIFAGIFGLLAGLTRSPGILLAVPAVIEAVTDLIPIYREKSENRLNETLERLVGVLLIPCGFLIYLIINKTVTGDAFTFMQYQREHWGQSLSYFFNTPEYQLNCLVRYTREGNMSFVAGTLIPNLLYIFASLIIIVLAAGKGKLRPSYTGYFAAYFVMVIGPTWLLSAPRYLTACFPLAVGLSCITEKRRTDIVISTICIFLMVLYLFGYVGPWSIY